METRFMETRTRLLNPSCTYLSLLGRFGLVSEHKRVNVSYLKGLLPDAGVELKTF